MAQAIACDLCQEEAAVMMQSNLANGDTIGVGALCMITFYAASLTTMLHDASPETLNAFSSVLVPLAAIIGPNEWDHPTAAEYPAPSGPAMVGTMREHLQADADQSEADSMAAEQSDAMLAEE